MPRVRVASHESYGRLVFDWPVRTEYEAESGAERLVLRFAGGVLPDLTAARRSLRNVLSVTAADGAVVIAIQPGARIRHFRIDNRIVVDVHDRAAGADTASTAPRAGAVRRAARTAPAQAVTAPTTPAPAVEAPTSASALRMGVETPTAAADSPAGATSVVETENEVAQAPQPAHGTVPVAALVPPAEQEAAPAAAPVLAARVATEATPSAAQPGMADPAVVAEIVAAPTSPAVVEVERPAAAGPVVVATIEPARPAATLAPLNSVALVPAAPEAELPAGVEPGLVAESAPIPTLILDAAAAPEAGGVKEPEAAVPVTRAAMATAPRAGARQSDAILVQQQVQQQLPPQRPGPRTMAPTGTPGFSAPAGAPVFGEGTVRNIQLAPGQPIPPLLGGPPAGGAPGAPGAPAARPPIVPIPIRLDPSAGRLLQLPAPAATVLAADPRIVRVQPASPTSLFIMAVAAGRTTVIATAEDGTPIVEYDVTVSGPPTPIPGGAPPPAFAPPAARAAAPSASSVESMIRRSVRGGEGVRVTAIGTRGYVLNGLVPTAADAQRAEAIAKAMGGEEREVINSLSLLSAIQVNVRVRIAEISRTVTRELGFNWDTLGASGSNWLLGMRFGAGGLIASTLAGGGVPAGGAATPARYGARFTNGRVDINSVIDALAEDSLVSILAEPNLTAMSGEVASFLAGGEFPVPVSGSSTGGASTVTIEFKQFGVSLAFVPTVLSPERLNLRVRPEVSELSDVGSISVPLGTGVVRIPALTVRRAETTVELGSGQSFAIAGLLSRSHTLTNSGIIGLADIPILGALFRSDRFRRQETELVIIVTPYLVRPTSDPRALQAPAERMRAATDWDRIVLRRQLARGTAAPPATAEGRRPSVDAGFIVE